MSPVLPLYVAWSHPGSTDGCTVQTKNKPNTRKNTNTSFNRIHIQLRTFIYLLCTQGLNTLKCTIQLNQCKTVCMKYCVYYLETLLNEFSLILWISCFCVWHFQWRSCLSLSIKKAWLLCLSDLWQNALIFNSDSHCIVLKLL